MATELITAQQVVEIVSGSVSFDTSLLSQHILKCQRKYIREALGEDLYDEVITQYEGTPTTAYETLIEDYIQPALARFVFFEASPFIRTNITSAGFVNNNTEFAQQSDKGDYGSIRSALISDAEYYRNELVDYLNDNISIFTLYDGCDYKKRNRPGIILE